MSLESERVFGQSFDKFTSSSEVDDLEEVFETAELILNKSFNFLKNPAGLPANKKMQEIADIGTRYIAKGNLEFTLISYEGIDDPNIFTIGDERMQVEIPLDFIQAAESAASDVLYFAVFIGSKMRDQYMGLDPTEEEADERAVLMQAEFLAWWEEASKDIGIEFYPTEEQMSLMGRFPHGIESVLNRDQYQNLKTDARRTRIEIEQLEDFDPSDTPYLHFEN